MSAVAGRIRTSLARVDDGLLDLRDTLTPGQRWTAALALALTMLVLLFGLPRTIAGPAGAAGTPVVDSKGLSGAGQQVASAPPGAPEAAGVAGYPAPSREPPAASAIGVPVSPTVPPDTRSARYSVPTFVALVRVGDRPEPGRDDAAIAKVFLARGGFAVTTLDVNAGGNVCAQAVAAGTVVLAGTGLDPALRDCLVGAGRTVIAFDGMGDRAPRALGGGQVLSTRRGVAASLVDLGRWARPSAALAGRVGLIVDRTVAAEVAGVVPVLRGLGIDIVATAEVSGDATSSSITDGVRAFAAKGVDAGIFVAPVSVQSSWLAQASVLAPSLRYLVVDAFDAITNESYPPSFDGSMAYTSLRVPWFAREHGATPAQSACLRTWQGTVSPPTTLSIDEEVDVFSWCEEVALVTAALGNAGSGGGFGALLRSMRLVSPLTSDLGPLASGGWGPTQDAVLRWRAACGCWQQLQPFTGRTS